MKWIAGVVGIGMLVAYVCYLWWATGEDAKRAPKPDVHYVNGNDVTVYHDDARHVTCWVGPGLSDRAMSCLPDVWLTGDSGAP